MMNGPQSFSTEEELLRVLTAYVKENNIRVESPDYLTTKSYSMEWVCIQDLWYYKVKGKVIALRDGEEQKYAFNPEGFAIRGA